MSRLERVRGNARALVLALALGCSSPSPYPEIDQRVPGILTGDRIPGAVIVVGTKDRVLYRRAFGDARPDTVFDLASCTKVIATTTAALKLVEEGRLALADPVGKHLKALEGRPVTIEELLVHRSGFPAYLNPRSKSADGILSEISALDAGEKKFVYS